MGKIKKVAGPLVIAEEMMGANMFDVVRVSEKRLIGEIIEISEDKASIQVYEETSGLKPGERVESTEEPLSIELGPGLISNMLDGIGRPLQEIVKIYGNSLQRGVETPTLGREKKWHFIPLAQEGQRAQPGDIIGQVQETPTFMHKIMVPVGVSGTITKIEEGNFTVTQTVATLIQEDGTQSRLTLMQKWPVRVGRPFKQKLPPQTPMVTGQRVIDTLFPIAKGGVGAVPGPFGSGKTVVQHQLAKWSESEVVIYIGCGERGNEMADVLNEFPEIIDPKTGHSLMQRTVLIANTSDMPVAAREASIYTGITIAEYFRDMGYEVSLMADSTSRWAEALREMSGRLEEMPGEEGYPAYLGSRLASFYERAGVVKTIGTVPRNGTLTIIGAVSPPGGDLSEPVSQATMRIVKVFWGLDSNLAYKRHFPAINWLNSYSLYSGAMSIWYNEHVATNWSEQQERFMRLLSQEAELEEIVKLVGIDAISESDRLKLEVARSIREDFLHQNAFHEIDTFTSLKKQHLMMCAILLYYDLALKALENSAQIETLLTLSVREGIGRFKYVPEEQIEREYEKLAQTIERQVAVSVDTDLL